MIFQMEKQFLRTLTNLIDLGSQVLEPATLRALNIESMLKHIKAAELSLDNSDDMDDDLAPEPGESKMVHRQIRKDVRVQ